MVAQWGEIVSSEVTSMIQRFYCPECKREHDEPAEAAFVLSVRCADCELRALLEAHFEASNRGPEAIPAAA